LLLNKRKIWGRPYGQFGLSLNKPMSLRHRRRRRRGRGHFPTAWKLSRQIWNISGQIWKYSGIPENEELFYFFGDHTNNMNHMKKRETF